MPKAQPALLALADGSVFRGLSIGADGSTTSLAVTRQPLVQTVVATGRVRADSRARLGAQVAGAVQRVSVREGDTVAAGTLLIQLDDRE